MDEGPGIPSIPARCASLALLPPLVLLVLLGCSAALPGTTGVAASRAAAARTVTRLPPPAYSLEVEHPAADDEVRVPIPWLEVSGRVGSAELHQADLVIALDLSVSSMLPSGMDLDDDGVIGDVRGVVRRADIRTTSTEGPGAGMAIVATGSNVDLPPPRQWATDPDDTIAQAELGATRAIIRNLASRGNRFGIVTYSDRGRVRASLGPPEPALESLERIRMPSRLVPTNVGRAIREARLQLTRNRIDDARQQAVLLFTDGRPTDPDPYLARLLALNEAHALNDAGIDLYLLPVGPLDRDAFRFLIELSKATNGRTFRVGDPRRLFEDLSQVELLPRRLDIENATTGTSGRGIRTDLDGRFHAYVPLAPGENTIRILAELGDGTLARWEQTVRHEPPESESDALRAETERVLRDLERRDADAAAAAADPL